MRAAFDAVRHAVDTTVDAVGHILETIAAFVRAGGSVDGVACGSVSHVQSQV